MPAADPPALRGVDASRTRRGYALQTLLVLRKGSLVVLTAVAAAVLALSDGAVGGAAKTQSVTVTMTEFKFVLKPRTVRRGAVVFTVVNRGKVAHDFRIAGKRTPHVRAGRRATLRVTFTKAGRYPYSCTLPAHAPAGMKGVLVVT
jgi:plastocyanin